jgi:hypothetical protein
MNRAAMQYTLGTIAVGMVVSVAGWLAVGQNAMAAVVWGAAVAVSLQVVLFWVLFVRAEPERKGLAYAASVVARFIAVGIMAFMVVPALRIAPAPALISMVACLFGSTLLEALFIQRRDVSKVGSDAATIRT